MTRFQSAKKVFLIFLSQLSNTINPVLLKRGSNRRYNDKNVWSEQYLLSRNYQFPSIAITVDKKDYHPN